MGDRGGNDDRTEGELEAGAEAAEAEAALETAAEAAEAEEAAEATDAIQVEAATEVAAEVVDTVVVDTEVEETDEVLTNAIAEAEAVAAVLPEDATSAHTAADEDMGLDGGGGLDTGVGQWYVPGVEVGAGNAVAGAGMEAAWERPTSITDESRDELDWVAAVEKELSEAGRPGAAPAPLEPVVCSPPPAD